MKTQFQIIVQGGYQGVFPLSFFESCFVIKWDWGDYKHQGWKNLTTWWLGLTD